MILTHHYGSQILHVLTTTTLLQPFYSHIDFVQDYPGELVPERWNQSGFTGARDSEWQWHQLGRMQICTSPQTDNHASISPLSFFTGRIPFLLPNQQHQSTEGKCHIPSSGTVVTVSRFGTNYECPDLLLLPLWKPLKIFTYGCSDDDDVMWTWIGFDTSECCASLVSWTQNCKTRLWWLMSRWTLHCQRLAAISTTHTTRAYRLPIDCLAKLRQDTSLLSALILYGALNYVLSALCDAMLNPVEQQVL